MVRRMLIRQRQERIYTLSEYYAQNNQHLQAHCFCTGATPVASAGSRPRLALTTMLYLRKIDQAPSQSPFPHLIGFDMRCIPDRTRAFERSTWQDPR